MKTILLFASIFGMTSIIMAAAGSHLLQPNLVANHLLSAYQKAVDYSLINAIFLLVIFVICLVAPALKFHLVGYLMIIAGLIFQLSLFVYSIFNIHWVAYLTPVGGTLMILSWAMIFIFTINNYSKLR